MLSTVIKIGNIYRKAGAWEKHRYIKPCPIDTDKIRTIYINIPVNGDMELDINSISFGRNENDKSLFYLDFKTSDTDSTKRYLFGDILRTKTKDKEDGNYRLGGQANEQVACSFDRMEKAMKDRKYRGILSFEGTLIEKFRNSFQEHKSSIHDLTEEPLKDGNGSVFVHFVFPDGKHWYELEEEMRQINKAFLSSFTKKTEHGLALDAFLYKTLGGIPPGLFGANDYKSKLFADTDEVMDLFYGVDISTKAAYSVEYIKVIILPIGDNLMREDLDHFFDRRLETIDKSKLEQAENSIQAENTNSVEDDDDQLFLGCDSKDELKSIIQFDIIFSKRASTPSAPDVDVIEISGISKSFLSDLSKRIRGIKRSVEQERKEELDHPKLKKLKPLNISLSFKNILGDLTKKYQSHLLKVLPKIYSGTYFDDPILLPAFIERVEFNVRNDKQPGYNFLKYDFFYLTKIQNGMEDKIKLLMDSKNYQAGFLLGKLARPLNQKIASFEKNYVGLLSRRISDLRGMIKLKDFIDEKLAIHNVAYRNLKEDSKKLAELVKELDPREYRKEECAFGFFESYYSFPEKEANEKTENKETNEEIENA